MQWWWLWNVDPCGFQLAHDPSYVNLKRRFCWCPGAWPKEWMAEWILGLRFRVRVRVTLLTYHVWYFRTPWTAFLHPTRSDITVAISEVSLSPVSRLSTSTKVFLGRPRLEFPWRGSHSMTLLRVSSGCRTAWSASRSLLSAILVLYREISDTIQRGIAHFYFLGGTGFYLVPSVASSCRYRQDSFPCP